MASRYAAVFPLSELINWIYHTRGQRHEELPHSYQMMLFWAGLRGAVGVALAAGITGDNADALRTTILVVVVLTVIVFGGTTARMLEVLGIRVGVEEEDASSDEDDGWTSHHGGLALQMGPGSRRYASTNGRGLYDEDELDMHSPADSPYLGNGALGSGSASTLHLPTSRKASMALGRSASGRPGFGQGQNQSRSGFSTNSEESDDDQPLPMNDPNEYDLNDPLGSGGNASSPSKAGMVFRDGQWFTALDERYLLPLFSNSVTARRHHARKALSKRASVYNGAGGGSGAGGESGAGTPRGGSSLELSREEEGDAESENGKNKLPRTFRWVSRGTRLYELSV